MPCCIPCSANAHGHQQEHLLTPQQQKEQQRLCITSANFTEALSLSSCLAWVVAEEGSRESVDAKCRRLTATWVRERHVSDHDIEVCDFYEQLERAGAPLAHH